MTPLRLPTFKLSKVIFPDIYVFSGMYLTSIKIIKLKMKVEGLHN